MEGHEQLRILASGQDLNDSRVSLKDPWAKIQQKQGA
jgi:hypothetical protein